MDLQNTSRRYVAYSRFACLSVFAVATIVAAGWLLQIPILVTFIPGYYQMKFNTALGFMLGAGALWRLPWSGTEPLATGISALCAGLLVALGAATFIQYPGHVNFAIDQLFAADFIDNSTHSGRMSAFTALGFVAVGVALLLMLLKRPPAVTYCLVYGIALCWIGVGVAFLYGLPALYGFELYGAIAIPTVACFILLSFGIMFARPQLGLTGVFTSPRFAGIAARRLLPAVLFIPVFFGWLLIYGASNGTVDLRIGAAIHVLSILVFFVGMIAWIARSVQQLEDQVAREQYDKTLALEQAAHLARYDVLTGLPNRALLHERLDDAIKMSSRRLTHVALLFLDLDRFKPINDTYGHAAGDKVLIEVARRLSNCVRETDTVSRQGGDEFVVLLRDLVNVSSASHIASHILVAITRPFLIDGNEFHLSASIGISLSPDDGDEVQTLTEHADAAMYYAKSLGRANFQFFASHINEHAVRRATIERQIRSALHGDGFVLRYQAKVDARSGGLAGLEALVRFKSDGFRPAEFIPVAEESNLIVPLGEWVLREACRQNRVWQDAGYPRVPVSVNVSPLQFRRKDFLQTVRKALADSGLEPCYLDIEVTESAAMEDFDRSVAVMGGLHELGVSMSIDDFGTGHSSLNYLKRFPIDALKIDRSFVQDLAFDAGDAAIVRAIIHLAQDLKREVIAEGVETRAQLAFLQAQGCDQVQGFYFGEPLSAEKVVEAAFARPIWEMDAVNERA